MHDDEDYSDEDENPNNSDENAGTYYGEINFDGEPHGEGHITFENCCFYRGTWKNGVVHGFGVLRSTDGRRCEGELTDGVWEGKITAYCGDE